ncbi:hypothetical protein XFHB_04890 [Xylella fastidiosa]|uniref:Uncharacterized protein n=1 Tax=Xylella fastidiosa TaxID=2371 RepID=A0ABC8ACZ5_XYLFS|nr:hypothetical protein [Xylella fastidiosa]ALR06286.2 hypothetical protein XFHB_04890 [Xylella fastidiosa]
MQETSETKMILRKYFTGEGASVRRRKFLWDVFFYSSKYFLICLCLFSWALVGGLLIGPQNEFFLRNFHAWMITTPIEEVLIQSHTLLFDLAFKAFLFSILLSVLINLKDVLLAHKEQYSIKTY